MKIQRVSTKTPPPAHFDAGADLTNFMSPPSQSVVAIDGDSAICAVFVDATPEPLKHAAAWFATLMISSAAGSSLKMQAATAVLTLLFVARSVFLSVHVTPGSYALEICMEPWSCLVEYAVEGCDSLVLFLVNGLRPITLPMQFVQSGRLPAAESLPLQSEQANEFDHATYHHTSSFLLSLVVGAILILVAAAVRFVAHMARRFCAINRSLSVTFGRSHRSVAMFVLRASLCCASCLCAVVAADVAIFVDPSIGQDASDCGQPGVLPCQTIRYALRSRQATSVLLSEGTFNETSVYIDSIALLFSVSGSRNNTVFDCGRRGPAFIISNSSVAFTDVIFQNCINFDADGTGGAISAHSNSIIAVTNCAFYNNTAQTGGAIGAISSTLNITLSVFENNTATCPSISAACLAWGGAIGAVEAWSVIVSKNKFNRNSVNLELSGVRDDASSAAGGGGCVSVLYNADVTRSVVAIDGNSFQRCSVRMSGSRDSPTATSGVQYGNAYGGAVSVYYGLRAASSLQIQNVASSFTNNVCRSCVLDARVGAGGSVYGGCLSVYAGSWSVNASGCLSFGSVSVDGMRANVSGNRLEDCGAVISMMAQANGANAYGGGVSVVIGAYCRGYSSAVSGNTSVSSSSYTISSNTLTSCTALSKTLNSSSYTSSFGANAYGGGVSVSVGAYSYSGRGSSVVSGSTAVNSSSYTISSNTLTSCNASTITLNSAPLASASYGANAYGGGVSVAVGAYSYSGGVSSAVSGDTAVNSSSYTISSNSLTSCTASSTTSGSSSPFSTSSSAGASAYGGGVSVSVGAYSYRGGGSSTVSGSITVSSSSYTISSNTLTSCTASSLTSSPASFSSSAGANAYGGGVSVAVGAYSYGDLSVISGGIIVSDSRYTISSNALSSCSSSSLTSCSDLLSSSSTSYGADAYGGGVSVVIGAYSRGYSSVVSGSTAVNSSNYTISSNALTNCTASSTSGPSSSQTYGANSYGGGVSVSVGAYSYSMRGYSAVSVSLISSCVFQLFNVSCARCSSVSSTSGFSGEAFSFGGAVAVSFESYVYPKASNTTFPITLSSSLTLSSCSFSNSISSSSSLSCSPGGSSAAGGALFVSVGSADVAISSGFFSDALVQTRCSAPSSQTHSLGGGVSILRAGDVVLSSSNIAYCRASGVRQANNVLVGGGGIFVQDAKSVTLESSFVSACSVEDAFSVRVLPCGGGAIGMTNVSAVRISNTQVYNNSDSSLSGAILLRHVTAAADMVVSIGNGSLLSSDPSISASLPVLNISCGLNCSVQQQQRVHLNLMGSTIFAQSPSDQRYQSAAVMALPKRLMLTAANSYLQCNFSSVDNIAALARSDADRMLITCAPCERPFHIATTSRSTMNLSELSVFAAQTEALDSCSAIPKASGEQSCPYGISTCSTIAYITVGFWTRFAADGSIGDAIRCPSNYCGCRNIPGYDQTICQLYPPFSVEYQPDDALCNGNRTGVLCGGCKRNFTQSLNGFSCVPNEICSETMPWVWAITLTGYIVYSVYILITSVKISSGLITCVLFYGQLSSFAGMPSQLFDASQASFAAWLSKVTQFGSIMSLYESACYGLDMGAYEATAAQLCGPAIVFSATLLLTAAAKRLLMRFSDFLQKHNFDVEISFGVTIINVLLLLFSSVSSVIFQLITCQEVGPENVVFIDGNKYCKGPLHNSLIAVAALLSVVPAVFWALLKYNTIPETWKSSVCSAYSKSRYYWGAVALTFRFLMTVIFATSRDFPSITALALLICSVFMFALLIILRPYADQRTYYVDMFCYICLIVQFALQVLVRASESLGVPVVEANSFRPVLLSAARASLVLRYAPFVVCALLIFPKALWHLLLRLGLGPGRFVRGRAAATASSVELRSQLKSQKEDLKSSLL